MRYDVNELLEEEDLLALTEEAAKAARPRRVWRRLGAVAACLGLMVCLGNFRAIAEELDRLWRYVSGVGTVAQAEQVLVQAGPAELAVGDRVYRVVNAYQQGDLVHLTVEVLFYGEEQETITLGAGLTCDGVKCLNDYGEQFGTSDLNVSVTQITPLEEMVEYYQSFGYGDNTARYNGAGAVTGCAMTFRAGEGDSYEVAVYAGTTSPTVPIGKLYQGSIELKLEPSTEAPAQPYDRETEWGTLTALVSDSGQRVQLVLERPEGEALQAVRVWPVDLCFVDEAGNRYRGVPVQIAMDQERQSQEFQIEREPEAPIVAIELPKIEMMLEDTGRPVTDGDRFRVAAVDGLDWTVEFQSAGQERGGGV